MSDVGSPSTAKQDYACASRISNREGIDDLRKSYVDFFKALGFSQVETEPLVPKEDKTVLFTNATITPLKPFLSRGEVSPEGWVVDQPCLRVQNLSKYPSKSYEPEFMSFFHMVGTFVPDLSTDFCNHLINSLKKCGLEAEDVVLRGCKRDIDLLESLSHQGGPWKDVEVSVVNQEEGYFDWKYGMDGLKGRGVHVLIKQPNGKEPLSIGQLVEISNHHSVIGYEFGFGVETFLSRLAGNESIFERGVGRECLGEHSLDSSYQDTLISGLAMHIAGVIPGNGGRKSLLRKTLRQVACIEFLNQGSIDDSSLAILYEEVSQSLPQLQTGGISEFIYLLNKSRENLFGQIEKSIRYASERNALCEYGQISRSYCDKKIDGYIGSFSFPSLVKDKLMLSLNPNNVGDKPVLGRQDAHCE